MARPTKSKEMKGKPLEAVEGGPGAAGSGGGGGGPSMVMIIAVALVVILGSAGASIASVYFLMPMVMQPMMDQVAAAAAKGGGHGGGHGESAGGGESSQVGPVVDLDEFTVNLSDPSGDRYLRADFSITVTTDDKAFGELSGEALKKWEEEFHMEMAHYVPAIRDIVISSLTQRSSEDLSTEEGKEAVKKEIKAKVDKLLHGHHEVIRVNIENFIIQ